VSIGRNVWLALGAYQAVLAFGSTPAGAAPPRPTLVESVLPAAPRRQPREQPAVEVKAQEAKVEELKKEEVKQEVEEQVEVAPEPVEQPAPAPTTASEDWSSDQDDKIWSQGDSAGRTIARGAFRGGKRFGKWMRYFAPNEGETFAGPPYEEFKSPFTAEAYFVDGLLDGNWKFYDANRRLAGNWQFHAGLPHGVAMTYFADGSKREQLMCRHGQIEGECISWDADPNQPPVKQMYAKGRRLTPHVQTNDAGTQLVSGTYADTSDRLEILFDWWHGLARTELIPGEPGQVKHGAWIWRYDSGQKQLEGTYDEGRPVGKFTWWHPNGQQRLQGTYTEGKAEGRFTWWHPNGQKQLVATYIAGSQVGIWTRWDPQGRRLEETDAAADPLAAFMSNPERF
jgi:YD repeat-containing protein